jgi:hypothetical protein
MVALEVDEAELFAEGASGGSKSGVLRTSGTGVDFRDLVDGLKMDAAEFWPLLVNMPFKL